MHQYLKRVKLIGGGLLLAASLQLPGVALPVTISDAATLKVSWSSETLFEVEKLTSAQLSVLKKWLENPPDKISISTKGDTLTGLPVELRVSKAIAKRWKSEPKSLALLFAERLNHALGDSAPKWNVGQQVVPLSESRIVRLSPFRPQDGLTVQVDRPDLVALEDLGSGRFRVSGLQRGGAKLLVNSESGLSVGSLPLWIKPWSARWGSGPGRFRFWGPLNEKRVTRKLNRWLGARALIGAQVELQEFEKTEDGPYTCLVRAEAPGALPVEAKFQFQVEASSSKSFPVTSSVVLSNHPERIISDGILFERKVSALPFRFMWHHRNDPDGPERHLVVQLSNPTSVTRRMRVLWHSFGPSPDEIHVGHTAALEYAKAGVEGLGEEIILPAGGARTIEIRYVKPGQTVSGMAWVGDVSGNAGPIIVRTLATEGKGALPTKLANNADPGRTASGVFPATIETDATHLLGGPFTYLEFGNEPYENDLEEGHPSYGNFGTLYRTRLVLKNPSQESADAVVGFASGGGAARGVLALDGELYDLPMGITGEGIPVRTYTLEPGESRQVDVELFPQAGSNYPVRVVVRSDFKRLDAENAEPLGPARPAIP